MSDLLKKPHCWFSYDAAHLSSGFGLLLFCMLEEDKNELACVSENLSWISHLYLWVASYPVQKMELYKKWNRTKNGKRLAEIRKLIRNFFYS